MLGIMASLHSAFRHMAAIAMFTLATYGLHAEQAGTEATQPASIAIEDLGKGTFTLSGPWQFHTGDDPAWASPAFDSTGWEQLTADQPWGKQGHANYTGFAWYRCSITLSPAPGVARQFSLLVPKIHDSYEVYWNGALIGRNGTLPPRPVWYISQPAQTFELGPVERGILALRVWKAPLLSDDTGERGGFDAAPSIGSPEAIASARAAYEFQWLRSRQLHFGANLLCAMIAILSFLLWLRTPARWVLFWTAGFALCQPAILLLVNAHLGLPYSFAMGAGQPVATLQDVSLWFLLLWLLLLHENRGLSRMTRILACICMVNSSLDGVLVAISWNPRWRSFAQGADIASAFIAVLLEAFPLFLVSYWLFQRKRLDPGRWLVAILAFVDEMMLVFDNVVNQGRQFTGWSIASTIESPLFTLDGNAISLATIAGTLLLVAIVYAVSNSVREDQRRHDVLQREKMELMHESRLMRHQAEHDGLTGLWNHRIIAERLSEEMNRALRSETPLSVILVDVDHFKRINDNYGHVAGDLVLREISEIFVRSLRPYDCVGRYGGEEFLVILPDCEMKSALLRAEHLRIAVQSARIMDGQTALQVTASFGVASAFPSDYDAESVIRAVDVALYRAKSNGRNCVVQAAMDAKLCES